MIKSGKNQLQNKAMGAVRDAAMLVSLRRPLRDAVTFCAQEKFPEPTTAKERRRVQ
jgi:hypothetical protein